MRKTFYAEGRLWVFYVDDDGTGGIYQTSTDMGATWGGEIAWRATDIIGSATWDMWYDGSTYLHYVYAYSATTMYYRRGELKSDGTITWSADEQTISISTGTQRPGIVVDSSGYAYIGYVAATTNYPTVAKNANNDGTWSTDGTPATLKSSGSTSYRIGFVLLSTGRPIALYATTNDYLYARKHSSGNTWDSEETAYSAEGLMLGNSWTAGTDSSDNTYVLLINYTSYDYIQIKRTSGGTWSTEVTLDTTGASTYYSFGLGVLPNGNLYVLIANKPTNNAINYKRRRGGTWDSSWTTISGTNINQNGNFQSIHECTDKKIAAFWSVGTVSPFSIYYFTAWISTFTKTADARLKKTQLFTKTSDANLVTSKTTYPFTKTSDARLKKTQSFTKTADARLKKTQKIGEVFNFFKYYGNPILSESNLGTWGSVLKVGSTYHMYYSYVVGAYDNVGHATSTDGINWTKDTANNPVLPKGGSGEWDYGGVWCPMVWKEDSTWYMIYTGMDGSAAHLKIGLATSSDGLVWTKSGSNPVLTGSLAWEVSGSYSKLENFGVMKVGSTYYLYYNTLGATNGRQIGIATSTNLTSWTKDSNNPIFTTTDYSLGCFCSFAFKYNGQYYILIPYYTSGSDYTKVDVYSDINPTFYSTSRKKVGQALDIGSGTNWDSHDQDTPAVLTDDIYRDSFTSTNGEIWIYYAGEYGGSWKTGLAVNTMHSDARLKKTQYTSKTSDARLKKLAQSFTKTSDAFLHYSKSFTKTADARLKKSAQEFTKTSDARLKKTQQFIKYSDARLKKLALSFTKYSDSRLKKIQTITKSSDAFLHYVRTITKLSDARLMKTQSFTKYSDALLKRVGTFAKTSDARLKKLAQQFTKTSDARLKKLGSFAKTSDAFLHYVRTITKASDARLKKINNVLTETSDARLKKTQFYTRTADARLRKTYSPTKNSDARLLKIGLFTKTSDALLIRTGTITKTSDAKLVTDINLVARYDMETLINTTQLKDLSGYENHGTPAGGVTIGGVTGISDNATEFDGSDDRIDLGTGDKITNISSNALTLIAWVKLDSYNAPILCSSDGDTSPYFMRVNGSGQIEVTLRLSTTNYTKTFGSENAVPLSSWTMISFTFDGTDWTVYINKTQQTPQTQAGTLASTSNSIVMGRYIS